MDALIFDFDGVLTDNQVLLDKEGNEWVRCHRGDGLAFSAFHKLGISMHIVSTETHPVVQARAKKLKVPLLQGVRDKSIAIQKLSEDEGLKLENILYVGNDLNDLAAMKICGYSVCPADSHPTIKEVSTVVLRTNGGSGVVRELLENVLAIDLAEVLYPQLESASS